jgi:hypothetical protein
MSDKLKSILDKTRDDTTAKGDATDSPELESDYKGFNTKDHTPTFRLKTEKGENRAPAWRWYVDSVIYSQFTDQLIVIFTTCTVEISGKNLMPLYKAIQDQRASHAYAFDKNVHEPVSATALKIDTIKVIVQGAGEEKVAPQKERELRKAAGLH